MGAGSSTPRKLDKQSPEYLLKSGLAGGLAGCAVRAISSLASNLDEGQ